MKKMVLICSVVTAVAITGSMTAKAAEHKHAAKAEKAEKALALQELTVTGTVEKIEKQKKDGPETKTTFRLTDADGTVVDLPKGEIDQYVGKKVTVVGQGYIVANGTKHIKTITRIEKAQAAPVVPAAPAK